jgi:hypothetical protein
MNRIFTTEEINLLIEALERQEAEIETDIVEAEIANASTSAIFAHSSDLVSVKLMKQFFENVAEQDDCMFAEGTTVETATAIKTFVK